MDRSLSQILLQAAERHPERPAVLDASGPVSLARLAARVDQVAARLTERGLTGKRLGVLLPNLPSFPLVLYGILRAGGSALLLNPMNSPRETEEFLRDAGVDAVFTTTPLVALLPKGVRALLADDLPDALRVVSETDDSILRLDGAPPPPPFPAGGER
ncbi:MAG TPA: AMP-binding protein, partial [Longimicrobiaceae bacterium]|nr:AMP-binding protein [Longimicrobiaceae bacterium]